MWLSELNPEVQDQIADQEAAAAAAASEAARSSRVWVPLDNYNDKFIHQVKRREEAESHLDYEKSNKVCSVTPVFCSVTPVFCSVTPVCTVFVSTVPIPVNTCNEGMSAT